MLKAAEFFVGGQQLVRLNEKVIGEVSRDHGINATELSILLFLAGNPDLNTAKDIVESRLMTKSSVSRAVDSLVRQGYIHTREDDSDRRITHLVLEERLPRSSSWEFRPSRKCSAFSARAFPKPSWRISAASTPGSGKMPGKP